ncbi:uncharacterized protein LOC143559828 [Bidens hawaiensis]|uniref:uncharacterized protein LOC143559828 n=1 Tax=Bidens hawaiensis TaxID=980011 RepID=UPI00404A2921
MAIGSSSFSSMLRNKEENHEDVASLPPKKRRNPNTSYPDVDIIALSPATLMAKNRFICEICFKGFPREQNLQLHKRGHNLPFNLKQSTPKIDVKRKVYLCPDPSCIHHNPSHALGDLTGIKKHYSRKHCEKRFKCTECPKMYAVEADLKAHTKTCGKKEYHCHCGTLFSRRDSFITHRAFCEALAGGGLLLRGPANGAGSSINTPMSLSLTDTSTGTNAPSIINLTHTNTSPAINVSQLGRNNSMVRPTMGFNSYRPSMPFFDQQNQYIYQGHFDTRFFNMNNFRNYTENGEGSTLFSHKDSAPAVLPQLSAAELIRKASLLGSNWSNYNSANSFVRGYNPTCFSNKGYENNIFNYVSSSGHAGPSMVNLSAGAAYEQQDCHHSGATITRDFLGVGEGISVSRDEPEST